jgi:hypothetical protein
MVRGDCVTALFLTAVWCAVHFWVFVSLRNWTSGARERFAFLLHLISFGTLTMISVAAWAAGWISFPVAMGMVALLGIYSLSVLELWSLSEGSYSLTMLAETARRAIPEAELVGRFRALGDQKKNSRLQALEAGGLITVGAEIALTPKGNRVARALQTLRTMANFQGAG